MANLKESMKKFKSLLSNYPAHLENLHISLDLQFFAYRFKKNSERYNS